MGSRVLSLWFPYLATDRIRRDLLAAEKVAGPLATLSKADGHHRLVGLCPLAERARLEPGMAIDQARRACPSLRLLPHDETGDLRLLETLRGWCERYTPWVAIDRSHEACPGQALWLDVSQAAHPLGGETALLADLQRRLRAQGLLTKAAIADHPGAAWALAHFAKEERRIAPVKRTRKALAALPVAGLRLDHDQVAPLKEAGIHRLGGLYAFSRQALDTCFGREVVRRLDQALGLIDEPIAPHAPLPAQQARMILAEPVTTPDRLRPTIERLVHQLAVGLEAAGLGARRLNLALYRTDLSTVTITIGLDRPSRDVEVLSGLLMDRAAMADLGKGIERVILEAVTIEPMLPEAIAWRGLGTDGAMPGRDLAWPSTRAVGRAATGARGGEHAPSYRQAALALKLESVPDEAPKPAPMTSLRLLRQPEPIEAIAPLPDEPPVLFRWRDGLHKVVCAQGPERVAPAWWRIPDHEQPSIGHEIASKLDEERRLRAYFAVEDSTGHRFWLFRQGLYQATGSALPTWYLHGIFG